MWLKAGPALVVLAVACSEPTAPEESLPVPAGATDPAWASIGASCSPASPPRVVPASRRDSLPPYSHGPTRTSDDDWADLARTAPGGWGGLYLEGGVPVMFLVDTTKRTAAIAAMKSFGFGASLDLDRTRARAGRWDFAQLADWYGYFTLHVWTVPGMRTGDINEVKNRIEFGVADQAARLALESRLAPMGLPCYLVAVEIRGGATAARARGP